MAKILIARLGALGDILHALPAVTAIRAALPDATLGWLIEERWTELLTARGPKPDPDSLSLQKPVVNFIHTVDTKGWRQRAMRPATLGEMYGARRRVAKIHYDLVIDFQGAVKSAVLARWSGARTIAGFGQPRESAARFFYSDKYPRVGEHVIEQNHALAALAVKNYLEGRELKLIAPALPCDPVADEWAAEEIAHRGIAAFALLNPGAGWGGKQWPPESYGAVAKALARHNLRSLVNAAPGEEELARKVIEASDGQASELRCSIGELIALTRRARIFIGGDTGPLHLAAALDIPVVAIYGPTDPARTGPFSPRAITLRHPQSQTTFSHNREADSGLLQITADEVTYAARHLLGEAHD
ncbi:MAG TPA: glycosyltransferase family 9 protein [Candidatus Angelobacter sp.]|nr:glycosyltransferase family 9 protein [Candidatus Angelobacter sp.]